MSAPLGISLDLQGVAVDPPLERLIPYCARPPFALDRLHLVGGRSDQILYLLAKPDPAGRTALRLSALEFASPYYPPLSTPSASSGYLGYASVIRRNTNPPRRSLPGRTDSLRFWTAWPRSFPHPASTATVTTMSSPPMLR